MGDEWLLLGRPTPLGAPIYLERMCFRTDRFPPDWLSTVATTRAIVIMNLTIYYADSDPFEMLIDLWCRLALGFLTGLTHLCHQLNDHSWTS